MAANPLLTTTAGAVLPVKVAAPILLPVAGVNELVQAIDFQLTDSKLETIPVLNPNAFSISHVAEGARKPISNGALGSVSITLQKYAGMSLTSMEAIQDLTFSPLAFIEAALRAKVPQVMEKEILGVSDGDQTYTSFFNSTVRGAASDSVTYDSAGHPADAIRYSVSAAIAKLRAKNYKPNAVVLALDFEQVARDARQSATGLGSAQPVFNGYGDLAYGLATYFSTNLHLTGAASGDMVGAVGDFGLYSARLHAGSIMVKISTEGTVIDDASNVIPLLQTNQAALLLEWRMGGVLAVGDAIVRINKA